MYRFTPGPNSCFYTSHCRQELFKILVDKNIFSLKFFMTENVTKRCGLLHFLDRLQFRGM
jgi:hypothetical protein